MLLAGSHWVIATEDVPRITRFIADAFELTPHFENSEFSEFVLPNRFRIAFFKPVGKAAQYFSAGGERGTSSFGVTVKDVDALYTKLHASPAPGVRFSGPPKDHPWGERSFLLIDPDGNRWEITQSPSAEGMLTSKP